MKKIIIQNLQHLYNKENTKYQYVYNHSVEHQIPTAVIGKSGSGKTTLLNLIAGFLTAQSGFIQYNDLYLNDLPIKNRPISYLMQNHILFDHLTVLQNILLGNKKQKLTLAIQLATNLGISGILHLHPNTISRGQKQRACLIQILLQERPIVLLDEPFAGLDYDSKITCIQQIIKHCKCYLIFTTHDTKDLNLLNAIPYNINCKTNTVF